MIGGTVTKIDKLERYWMLHVVSGFDGGGIPIFPTPEAIQVGDEIWWQAQQVLWTPQDGLRHDVVLDPYRADWLGNELQPGQFAHLETT
jgi:hypothetical protein